MGAWYRLLKLVHERPTVLRGASAEERTETEASLAKLEPAIWNARLAPWPHAPKR